MSHNEENGCNILYIINFYKNTYNQLDSIFYSKFIENDIKLYCGFLVKKSIKSLAFSQRNPLSLLNRFILVLTPLLLLPYSLSTQALTTNTSNVINGSGPYLTFDGGRTKVTTTDGLLGITLSDGTKFTPSTNTSSAKNPITLPSVGQSSNDISMLIPQGIGSIALNSLIENPYNYWGDNDGDGQGTGGISATGTLSVSIINKHNTVVNRDDELTSCNSPYKLVLSSTGGELKTQYGVPNSSTFNADSVVYYINPKNSPAICFARPNQTYATGNYAGPANVWSPTKGFLTQSTNPSSYSNNFPTTGSNGLYFELHIEGEVGQLRWPSVTQGGITATMTPNVLGTVVQVKLIGPAATDAQQKSNSPSPISKPPLPLTFELVGYDSNNNAVVKYGFVLKQWFVNRGDVKEYASNMSSWCNSIGYRVPKVKDLTNAVCSGGHSSTYCQGSVGATPSSVQNTYQRQIGAGFFTEWGEMGYYTGVGIDAFDYWTSDVTGSYKFVVYSYNGAVSSGNPKFSRNGICSHP